MTQEVKSHYLDLGGLQDFYERLRLNDLDGMKEDIALLQAAYQSLQAQTEPVVGALPASGQTNVVYRVPGVSSYSEYMWDGTQFVLMATFSNAIDQTPTANSENLVTSGGVKAALDGCLKTITQSQFDNIFEL